MSVAPPADVTRSGDCNPNVRTRCPRSGQTRLANRDVLERTGSDVPTDPEEDDPRLAVTTLATETAISARGTTTRAMPSSMNVEVRFEDGVFELREHVGRIPGSGACFVQSLD
jgi:hypothetical protein